MCRPMSGRPSFAEGPCRLTQPASTQSPSRTQGKRPSRRSRSHCERRDLDRPSVTRRIRWADRNGPPTFHCAADGRNNNRLATDATWSDFCNGCWIDLVSRRAGFGSSRENCRFLLVQAELKASGRADAAVRTVKGETSISHFRPKVQVTPELVP
jgi:hypothetical protein